MPSHKPGPSILVLVLVLVLGSEMAKWGHPSVNNDHKSFPQSLLRRIIRALTQRQMQSFQAPAPIRVSLCSAVVEKIAIPRHDGRITDVKPAQTPIRCGDSAFNASSQRGLLTHDVALRL